MDFKQELALWLEPWAEASAQIESAPSDTCLTAAEISDFIDNELPASERERAAAHLAQCSYCAREVGDLVRAARDFDDRIRARTALADLSGRLSACLRVFVNEARGAFTRADALLQGLAAPVHLHPVLAPAGLGNLRGDLDTDEAEGAGDPYDLQEVALHGEALPGTEILCSEEDGGSVLVSMAGPWEVRLVAPDGSTHPVAVERGEDRYYANVTGMAAGEYLLAILRPEGDPPSPPSA
jgi:hypothetical protein